eukprot:Colp12_sorted_trinity150504_noHs@8871
MDGIVRTDSFENAMACVALRAAGSPRSSETRMYRRRNAACAEELTAAYWMTGSNFEPSQLQERRSAIDEGMLSEDEMRQLLGVYKKNLDTGMRKRRTALTGSDLGSMELLVFRASHSMEVEPRFMRRGALVPDL